jgi:hypothetical protein
VTPFEIIAVISIYIIVVAMGSIEHESGYACITIRDIKKRGKKKCSMSFSIL